MIDERGRQLRAALIPQRCANGRDLYELVVSDDDRTAGLFRDHPRHSQRGGLVGQVESDKAFAVRECEEMFESAHFLANRLASIGGLRPGELSHSTRGQNRPAPDSSVLS
jgi:hypothetical protein